MAKNVKDPYNPRIPPQRDIEEIFKNEIASRKGVRRTTRGPGEYYLSTCVCGDHILTSEWKQVFTFEGMHAVCE